MIPTNLIKGTNNNFDKFAIDKKKYILKNVILVSKPINTTFKKGPYRTYTEGLLKVQYINNKM